jgi:hypothetical protein
LHAAPLNDSLNIGGNIQTGNTDRIVSWLNKNIVEMIGEDPFSMKEEEEDAERI